MTKSFEQVVIPASFDPITRGHLHLIQCAAQIYKHVHVLVCDNIAKQHLLTIQQRFDLVSRCIKSLDNANITIHLIDDLVVRYMFENNIQIIIRGVRDVKDFNYECFLALANKKLYKQVKDLAIAKAEIDNPACVKELLSKPWTVNTAYFYAHEAFSHISSTAVRNLLRDENFFREQGIHYLPPEVYSYLEQIFFESKSANI